MRGAALLGEGARDLLAEKARTARDQDAWHATRTRRRRLGEPLGRDRAVERPRDVLPDSCRLEDTLGREWRLATLAHRAVESIEQLREPRVAALALGNAVPERGRGTAKELPAESERIGRLVNAARARSDEALDGAAHEVGVHRAVRADEPQVAFHGPPLERHDEGAGEAAPTDERVDRTGRADLDRGQLRLPIGRRKLERAEQEVDRVRQDVEELEIGRERHAAVRAAAHGAEGEIALDVYQLAERGQQRHQLAGGGLIEQLVTGAEEHALRPGERNDALGGFGRLDERLLDVDVTPRLDRLRSERFVRTRRRRDVDDVYRLRGEHLAECRVGSGARRELQHRFARCRGGIHDRGDAGAIGEPGHRARVMLPHLAGADDGDADGAGGARRRGGRRA